MNSDIKYIVDKLANSMSTTANNKTSGYNTTAEVRRVDEKNGLVWVHIPGGVDETPIKQSVSCKPGDQIQVHVQGGTAYTQGNYTSPPTDDTRANQAYGIASDALDSAVIAKNAADSAVESAEIAKEAADDVKTLASEAKTSASEAKTSASEAKTSALEAKTDATVAKQAADKSLTQLSIIEDVAGTVDWISKHGSFNLTTDTTVHEGTVYFVYNTTTQDYDPIVDPDPEANPMQNGWYVLDISDSQTEYIMAHIAITGRGLWVLPSGMATGTTPASGETQDDSDARQGSGYKALLSNDGMRIYDSNGDLVSTFGESIVFSSDREQKVGGDDNYISFNPENGSISIVGGDVRIGSTGNKLTDVVVQNDLEAINLSINGGYEIQMTSIYENQDDVKLDESVFYEAVDAYAIYDEVLNPDPLKDDPSSLGWYELVSGSYIVSENDSVVPGKTYYIKTPNYGTYYFEYNVNDQWDLYYSNIAYNEIINPPAEANPVNNGWYEIDNDIYVLSQDTEVIEGKTYYIRTGTSWTIPNVDILSYGITLNIDPNNEDYISIAFNDVVGFVESFNERIDTVSDVVDQNATSATNELNSVKEDLELQINNVAESVTGLTDEEITVLQNKTAAIYFTPENGFVIYGGGDDINFGVKLQLKSDVLNFINGQLGDPSAIVAYISQNLLNIPNARIEKQLVFGNYAFIRRSNGNMSLKWLG